MVWCSESALLGGETGETHSLTGQSKVCDLLKHPTAALDTQGN